MKNRWESVARRLAAIPVPATLFVLALGLFLWGALVVSPWFDGAAVISAFGHNRLAETLLGVIYMLIGGTRIVGVAFKCKRLMLGVPYGLMMGYLYLALLRINVVGWLPLTWLPLVICAVIAGICRLAILYGGKVE